MKPMLSSYRICMESLLTFRLLWQRLSFFFFQGEKSRQIIRIVHRKLPHSQREARVKSRFLATVMSRFLATAMSWFSVSTKPRVKAHVWLVIILYQIIGPKPNDFQIHMKFKCNTKMKQLIKNLHKSKRERSKGMQHLMT